MGQIVILNVLLQINGIFIIGPIFSIIKQSNLPLFSTLSSPTPSDTLISEQHICLCLCHPVPICTQCVHSVVSIK